MSNYITYEWRDMAPGERLPKHLCKIANHMTANYEYYILFADDELTQCVAEYAAPRVRGLPRKILLEIKP